MALDSGRCLFGFVVLPIVLPRHIVPLGRQGGMEGLSTTEGEILFLARAPSAHLDGGSQEEAWASGFRGVRPLRPGGRDNGPSARFLRFHKGTLVSLASP